MLETNFKMRFVLSVRSNDIASGTYVLNEFETTVVIAAAKKFTTYEQAENYLKEKVVSNRGEFYQIDKYFVHD